LVLPSLEDTLAVIILVIPGFISVKVFARITAFDHKLSDFDTTVYSLGTSLAIYVPFVLLTGLDNFDKVRDYILLPANLGLIGLLSVGSGTVSGIGVKLLFRKRFHWGDVWEGNVVEIEKRLSAPYFVIANTVDNQEIIGQISSAGTRGQSKDLLLAEPKLIIRNKDLTVREQMPLGTQVYIPEHSITKLVFLSEPKPRD